MYLYFKYSLIVFETFFLFCGVYLPIARIDEFWVFCYETLNQFKCDLKENNSEEFIKKDQVNFKLISAKLYKKNI